MAHAHTHAFKSNIWFLSTFSADSEYELKSSQFDEDFIWPIKYIFGQTQKSSAGVILTWYASFIKEAITDGTMDIRPALY